MLPTPVSAATSSPRGDPRLVRQVRGIEDRPPAAADAQDEDGAGQHQPGDEAAARAGCGRAGTGTPPPARPAAARTRVTVRTQQRIPVVGDDRRRDGRDARGSPPAARRPAAPAAPSTVISPSVSKPRKSTRITLTTLVPPPSGSALREVERRDRRERPRRASRSAIAAMPRPAAPAMPRRATCVRAPASDGRSLRQVSAARSSSARWSPPRPAAASAPGPAPRTGRTSGSPRVRRRRAGPARSAADDS